MAGEQTRLTASYGTRPSPTGSRLGVLLLAADRARVTSLPLGDLTGSFCATRLRHHPSEARVTLLTWRCMPVEASKLSEIYPMQGNSYLAFGMSASLRNALAVREATANMALQRSGPTAAPRATVVRPLSAGVRRQEEGPCPLLIK